MTDTIRHGWKIFTHDRCSPIQGGPAVWDGTYPATLPTTYLDRGPNELGWAMER